MKEFDEFNFYKAYFSKKMDEGDLDKLNKHLAKQIAESPMKLSIIESMQDTNLNTFHDFLASYANDEALGDKIALSRRLFAEHYKIRYFESLAETLIFRDDIEESPFFNLSNVENLIDSVILAKELRSESIEQERKLRDTVLTKVLKVLRDISNQAPATKLSELNELDINSSRGAPKKTAEYYERFAYIRALIDSGMSETGAFKDASNTFHVTVDSLRKPYKKFCKKRAKLDDIVGDLNLE